MNRREFLSGLSVVPFAAIGAQEKFLVSHYGVPVDDPPADDPWDEVSGMAVCGLALAIAAAFEPDRPRQTALAQLASHALRPWVYELGKELG